MLNFGVGIIYQFYPIFLFSRRSNFCVFADQTGTNICFLPKYLISVCKKAFGLEAK